MISYLENCCKEQIGRLLLLILVNFRIRWILLLPKVHPFLQQQTVVVTHIQDDSNVGGSDASYWFYSNFITIKHSNGEYSRYDHLDYKSSKVELNQNIHAGEEISKVGMTGFRYVPHLHFKVYVYTGYNIWTDFETIEIKNFRNIL